MWYIILALLAIIYLLNNTIISLLGDIGSYLIRPMLWLCLFIVTLKIAQSEGLNILNFKRIRRWNLGKTPVHAGVLLGGFQVSVLILVGIFSGFGKSPYSFSPIAILINMFFVGSFLLGTELSRSYIINKGAKTSRNKLTYFIMFATLLYMLISISADQFNVLNFQEPVRALEFIGKVLITALSMNILASYLSYLGGATASMGYVGILLAFEWFSPILPNPHWTIIALVGTVIPSIGFTILQQSIESPEERKKRHRRKKSDHASWTAVAIFGLIVVFFSFGYLGVKPTVVYSGSMSPTLQVGDIVIIDKVEPEEIKEGDIIQYLSYDNVTIIVHRVVEIQQGEKTFYITKGDANDKPDSDLIAENRILGKSIFTIPKIGLIQIFIRNIFSNIGA